jgi:hypothetical protein
MSKSMQMLRESQAAGERELQKLRNDSERRSDRLRLLPSSR